MKKKYLHSLLITFIATYGGCAINLPSKSSQMSDQQFTHIMQDLAAAWNDGNAEAAANMFTDDAVYSEPPAKQIYKGRKALFDFFGGANGRPGMMSMRWHHLAYREKTQIGFGEFSFTYGTTAHGVAIVRVKNGKIANWREYWYGSELTWEEFVKENKF